ncbi:MAG: hypothetical protein NC401_17355 [Ruminococcus sp.]|nr:hypothetical protein [Ruminococcus sp.]MCM1439035.1 hypothetical protein [Roseburia sp.]
MKHIRFIIMFAMLIFIATACRTTRPTTAPQIVTITDRDSVRVETRTITEFVHDTVTVEIPAQTAERTTADSLSFLENDFAVTTARINADGTLFHTLMTKPGKIDIGFDKPIQTTTTTAERIREIEKPVPVEVPVEVERKLTWWQSVCIKSAPWLFAMVIIAIGFIFRTPIFNFARRFINSK